MPRVLLVDDNDTLRGALAANLRAKGMEVVDLDGGGDAIALLAEDKGFDVVVTDIQMPQIDGLELLHEVQLIDPEMPVILVTGVPGLDTAMAAVNRGALRYLTKPVDSKELVDAIVEAERIHRLARIKGEALELLGGEGHPVWDQARLESQFERAMGTLWMAYQPIVDCSRREVYAYEALMRSDDPDLTHPGLVLEAAEQLGRLPYLGQRIRAQVAECLARQPDGPRVFVNLHPDDLRDEQLYDPQAPLSQHANRVFLELTERATVHGQVDLPNRMMALRELGYGIAIDDLGAGYSSLNSFVQLRPDLVKIDMALVRNIHRDPRRRKLVRSLLDLSHDMGVEVVLEGVEEMGEVNTLLEIGGRLLQGYIFARPERPFVVVEPALLDSLPRNGV